MAGAVTLTAAVRQNLLSLQSTTDLIGRTQNRLSTGLSVASAIDDPVSFFQAKAVADRASDFQDKKKGIDQGISTMTAATDALTGVEAMVRQLKGLAANAKSATTQTEIDNVVTQFNDLRTQINNLTSDATYQGLNLVNGTGSTLTVDFSNDTSSKLTVNSVDVRADQTGLDIAKLSATSQATTISFNVGHISAGTIAAADTTTAYGLTVGGQSTTTLTAGDSFTLKFGTQTFTITVTTSTTANATVTADTGRISAGTYSVGLAMSFAFESAGSSGASSVIILSSLSAAVSASVTETQAVQAIAIGFTDELNNRITNLDSALTTLRSRAQTLGANVAILNTRLDFTKNYVNTLTAGAGKLTLADLNEEGANLLALQTRQQLGIQSLAFAGKSEQAILGLFR